MIASTTKAQRHNSALAKHVEQRIMRGVVPTNSKAKGALRSKIILNSNPDPWIIDWSSDSVDIQRGTDIVGDPIDFDVNSNNLLTFRFDDGGDIPQFSGSVEISMDNGEVAVSLFDIRYDALSRGCDRGNTGRGELLQCGPNICVESPTITITTNKQSVMSTCPGCLRNVVCGAGSGRFVRGDCSQEQIDNSSNNCQEVYRTPDGTILSVTDNKDQTYTDAFESWSLDLVNEVLEDNNVDPLF